MSREEFENYVSVDANVITFEMPTPEDIAAEIQAKVDEINNESGDDSYECEEFQNDPPPIYSMTFENTEELQTFSEARGANVFSGYMSSPKNNTTRNRQ